MAPDHLVAGALVEDRVAATGAHDEVMGYGWTVVRGWTEPDLGKAEVEEARPRPGPGGRQSPQRPASGGDA
ncbi:MAG TPA: hypothetical protein VIK38_15730 [Coriobacteriia bacterium]